MNNKPAGSNITPSRKEMERNPNPTFMVLVKASGSRVEGLTVDAVHEPERGDASIVFLTKAGKKWKMHFNEFSFVFPATQPKAA